MYSFSPKSERNLMTCHTDIQLVFRKVIEVVDCSIICGHRGKEAQQEAYLSGFSQLQFPDSNHNVSPSNAIDVIPYPVDWENINSFYRLNGVILTICKIYKVELTWGGSWKMKDYPHYELT